MICVYTYIYMCIHTHIRKHTDTRKHIRLHTYTHNYIRIHSVYYTQLHRRECANLAIYITHVYL